MRASDTVDLKSALDLGTRLLFNQRYGKALRCYAIISRQTPLEPRAQLGLGQACLGNFFWTVAKNAFRRALIIDPSNAATYANVGVIYRKYNAPLLGEAILRRGIVIDPDNADMHVSLAFILLQNDAWLEGWQEYEYRLNSPDAPNLRDRHLLPTWNGQPLASGKLLLLSEQGAGDTVQFLRYLRELRDAGVKTVFAGSDELHGLAARASGVQEIASHGLSGELSTCMLMSLPHRHHTTVETTPARVPYLSTPMPNFQLNGGPNLRVGITWTGNQANSNNPFRSCPWEALQQIFTVPNIDFYALQVGFDVPVAGHRAKIFPLHNLMTNFAATASLIAQMDLVVTIDTSVGHIAGALNIPVWLMLGRRCDWRWLLGRTDSPWYPSMRIFRLRSREPWNVLVEKLTKRLQRIVAFEADPAASLPSIEAPPAHDRFDQPKIPKGA